MTLPDGARKNLGFAGGFAAIAVVLLLRPWSAAAAEDTFPQRREHLQRLSPEDLQEVLRNYQKWQSLSVAERQRLSNLADRVQTDVDQKALLRVMKSYYAWLRRLGPASRAELLKTPANQRMRKLRELQDRQELQRRVRIEDPYFQQPALTEDFEGFARWLDAQLSAQFDEPLKEQFAAATPQERRRLLAEQVRRRRLLAGATALSEQAWSNEQIQQMVAQLSPTTRQQLDRLPSSTKRLQLAWYLRLFVLTSAPSAQSDGPSVSEAELKRFFVQEVSVSPQLREYLQRLPSADFLHVLTQLHRDAYPSAPSPASPSN